MQGHLLLLAALACVGLVPGLPRAAVALAFAADGYIMLNDHLQFLSPYACTHFHVLPFALVAPEAGSHAVAQFRVRLYGANENGAR